MFLILYLFILWNEGNQHSVLLDIFFMVDLLFQKEGNLHKNFGCLVEVFDLLRVSISL